MKRGYLLVLAVLLLAPTPVEASPFDVFGFGSRATAMGSAQGAAARDHASIYYNPANLVLRRNTHFGLATHYVNPQMYIESDVPEQAEPELPAQNMGLSLGFVFPLGGRLDYRVSIGFALFVPLIELTRLEAIDPAKPFFYMYEGLPDHLVIAPAIGFRITDWLRIGAGVQILAALNSGVNVTGDVIDRRMETRSLTVDLAGTTGPIVGLSTGYGPFELGVTFRDELQLSYQLPILFDFEGVGTLTLDVGGTSLYSPRQVNIGTSYHIAEPDLLLAADLTIALWSSAPDPTAQISAVVTDEELRPEEDTVGTLFDIQSTPLELGAQDVVIPRFGIEWRINDMFMTRAGYFHRPAILPDQVGYTSMMDNSVNVFSIGGGVTFPDPLQLAELPMTIDCHLQLNQLVPRQTVKDPEHGAPEAGAMDAGGTIWNVGLELRQDF